MSKFPCLMESHSRVVWATSIGKKVFSDIDTLPGIKDNLGVGKHLNSWLISVFHPIEMTDKLLAEIIKLKFKGKL